MPRNYNAPRRSNDNPIAVARLAKGMTQAQLAHAIGVNQKQISSWELGRFNPPIAVIEKIAEVLEVDWLELVKGQRRKSYNSTIAAARKEKGMTQGELAKEIGISQALLSNYETGASIMPMDVLNNIARVLKMPPEALLDGQKRPK